MIKSNELRIGNWVKERITMMQEKEPSVVVNEHYIQIASNHFCGTGYGFFPVPLTPEILERCGFELNSNFIYPDKSIAAKWKKGFYLISEFYTDEGYGIEWIIGGGHSVCPVQIKYLHQLQNLYFALTGEELKINLNWTIAAT